MARRGNAPAAGKTGPDYIDSGFLSAAAGRKRLILTRTSQCPKPLAHLAADQAGDTLIIEGVMGLFDGANGNAGSSAALAEALDIPVILVMDIRLTPSPPQ